MNPQNLNTQSIQPTNMPYTPPRQNIPFSQKTLAYRTRVYKYFEDAVKNDVPDTLEAMQFMLSMNPCYYSYLISRMLTLNARSEEYRRTIAYMTQFLFDPTFEIHEDFLYHGSCVLVLKDERRVWNDEDWNIDEDDTYYLSVEFFDGYDSDVPYNMNHFLGFIRELMENLEDQSTDYMSMPMFMFPVIRALTHPETQQYLGDQMYDMVNYETPALSLFYALRRFDKIRLARSGDVEMNPGPNRIELEEHLKQRMLFSFEPPIINPHSMVDTNKTISGVVPADPEMEALLRHMYCTPTPSAFLKYENKILIQVQPVCLKPHKASSKIYKQKPEWASDKYSPGPLKIYTTPLEQAISLLSEAGGQKNGVYCVPIYFSNENHQNYYFFKHHYRRRDGKTIDFNVYLIDREAFKPRYEYVAVTELKFLHAEYFSFCLSKYFEHSVEKALLTGERKTVRHDILTMFNNNPLITNAVESCPENFFNIFIYARKCNFELTKMLPASNKENYLRIVEIAKAPVLVNKFRDWIIGRRHLFKSLHNEFLNLRFNQYGLGSALSFGTFNHKTTDAFAVYISNARVWQASLDIPDSYVKAIGYLLMKIFGNELAAEHFVLPTVEKEYALIHIVKQGLLSGVCSKKSTFLNTKIHICAMCFTRIKSGEFSIPHCMNFKRVRQEYKAAMDDLVKFEGVFNYWFQKITNMKKPTFNSFLYYAHIDDTRTKLLKSMYELKAENVTMFGVYNNIKKISEDTPKITEKINSQLDETQKLLEAINQKDFIARTDRALQMFEPTNAPSLDMFQGLSDFTHFIDNMVNIKITSFIQMLFPLFDPNHFPNISITKIIRDYVLMKHIDNTLMKGFVLMDLLKQAGLIEAMTKFFQGFQIMTKIQETTAWTDLSEWVSHFLSLPGKWINQLSGFVGGFVSAMLGDTKFDAKSLQKFISQLTSPIRSISAVATGFNGINTIFTFISKAYYMAKEYVYTLLGKECVVPIYVHLRDHLTKWSSAVTTLMLPMYRNTILTTPDAWPVIDQVHDLGIRLLSESKGNGLNGIVTGLVKDLVKLRSQISLKRGLRQSTIVPFVIHLDGPPNIGKSSLVMMVVKNLATALGIQPDVYMYNEMLKFMDGYAGQTFLVCDDTNLNKTYENTAWLIKTVSPNLCTLSTAINEERPLISNIKVIILTSNTKYSQISDIATTKGIDRRSSHKFSVTAKHYQENQTKINKNAQDFDWDTEHNFVRIPSVSGDVLDKSEEFEGGLKDWMRFIVKECLTHIKSEKERVLSQPLGYFEPVNSDSLMSKLLDGLTPGNDQIDLAAIKEQISQIKFISSETFLHQPTMMRHEEEHIDDILDRSCNYNFERARVQMADVPNAFRTLMTYPKLEGPIITYTGARAAPNEVTIIQTEPLYGRYFEFRNLKFDYYFLHHLNQEDIYTTRTYYKRNHFTSNNISVRPEASTLDYESLQSLTSDSSFMQSWELFFSQSDTTRARIYSAYKTRIQTTQHLLESRNSWFTRFSNFFSRVFSSDNLNKLLITSLIGMTSIASVAMTYEALASIMHYEETKKYYERLDEEYVTSQAGKAKPVTKKTGIATLLTSSVANQNYNDIRTKVTKNVYLAQILDCDAKIVGTCNITFITERYALIPHHAVVGVLPLQSPRDPDLCAINIYSILHQRYVRYYFNRRYYRFPQQDAVLAYIPAFQAQSNIVPLFMKEVVNDICVGSETEVIFYNPSVPNMLEKHTGKYQCFNDLVKVTIDGVDFHYDNEYCVALSLLPGSSGSPHFLNNNRYQTKVLGIQSSSGFGNSHIVRLTQHQLLEALEYFNEISPINAGIPTCDVPYEPCFDPETPSLIGTVEPRFSVTISPKTQLKKTPWFEELIKQPNKTPVLSRVSKEDRYLYVNKTEKTQPIPFPQHELDQTVDEYSEYIRNILHKEYGPVYPSILSLHKVLNGDYIGGKSIDLTTSPGIGTGNWINTRTSPGQNDFVYRENDTYHPTQILVDSVSTLLSELITGKISTSTYASFPKDELRNKDARGIDGAPIEQKEVYKMLFASVDGMLSAMNRGQLKYGLGIDLFSSSGVKLISRMTPHIMMWDFSNYDGSITLQMYEAAARIYNNLSGNDEFSVARTALARITCQATIVADHKVYQPLKGMRSGFGGTSSFNTHLHNIILIMALKNILRDHIVNPTLHDIFSIIDWITFGDDGLSWLKDPEYSEIINGTTISQQFIDFGLIVSDPRGKSSLPPKFVNVEEAMFLKQSPYWDDVLKLPIWRVGEECLESVFSYYSGNDPTEPLDCAFRMLWPYGRTRFENYRKKLNSILIKSNKKFQHDWFTYYDAFRKSFDGVCYTGSLYRSGIASGIQALD